MRQVEMLLRAQQEERQVMDAVEADVTFSVVMPPDVPAVMEVLVQTALMARPVQQ